MDACGTCPHLRSELSAAAATRESTLVERDGMREATTRELHTAQETIKVMAAEKWHLEAMVRT